MKIGVVGAGAIGGFLAGRLADAGHQVSVLARGATLAALRHDGLRVESEGRTIVASVQASDSAHALGPQELLILAVKGPALPTLSGQLAPMMDDTTVVVPALNGLPWWYFLATQGPLAKLRLTKVDPGGAIERAISTAAVVGSVVYPSCSSPQPGLVRHASGNRLVFGEPGGGPSSRANMVAQVFKEAGFDAAASDDVRREIWIKLLGNMCWNPVSLITGASTDLLISDARVHSLVVGMMSEGLKMAGALGFDIRLDPEERIAVTRKLGRIKTSMLQDVEAGRAVEIEGIIGAPLEAARALGVEMPLLETIYALARMRATILGLMPVQ